MVVALSTIHRRPSVRPALRARGRRLAFAWALSSALAGLFAGGSPLAADGDRQVLDYGQLEPGRVYPTTATAVNESCRGAHDFRLEVEGGTWYRITGPTVLGGIRRGEQRSTEVEVDTRGLAPGAHELLLKIRCTTCPPPPKCTQDITEIVVRLRIPTIEQRYDPIPEGFLPPTETRCGVTEIEGRFEPVQGVWQDDPVFPDEEGKQLRQLNPRLLEAELKMVVDRSSTLFGTIRPVGARPEARRGEIFLRGKADGQVMVPVRIRVSLLQGGGERQIWTSAEPVAIPIGPPCLPGADRPFEVAAPVGNGAGDFRFAAGTYLLQADLIGPDDRPTGLRVRLLGEAVETVAPRVLFRPVYVTPLADRAAAALTSVTEELERRSARGLADWFPLRDGSLVTRTLAARGAAPAFRDEEAVRKIVADFRPGDPGELGRLILRQAMSRQFRTGALVGGFDRMIVTLNFADFQNLRTGPAARAVAFTNSRKVSFLDIDTAPFHWTVAHELVHTLPYPWTSRQVVAECGVDYHDKLGGEAHGLRLHRAGDPQRALQVGVLPLFGQATRETPWITQCTYWHLLKTLGKGPPDPPVILVQGYVGSEGGEAGARLLPAYRLDGVPDLEEAGDGEPADGWAIELLGEGDTLLARFPFEPEWTHADTAVVDPVVSFGHVVPDREGVVALRLAGPGGVAELVRYSPNAPEVQIVTPAPAAMVSAADGRLRLEWRGSDADGDRLLYTVLHSEDGGETWADLAFEVEETELEVVLDPGAGPQALRVLATDGARSAEARLDLSP